MFLYYYLKNTAIYMDKNLVFQDEIENFFSRRERESLTFNLVVRDKIERLIISSHGRARKNGANYHENFLDQDILLGSGTHHPPLRGRKRRS